MEDKTLIDIIEAEMAADDVDRGKQSKCLKYAYTNASFEEKKAIDDCFIALCGWSLVTLIARL